METIIAQATPLGESAIAIIRVSGINCRQIIKNACKITKIQPRHANLSDYIGINGNYIDQVIITFFEKGKSYTGEECLEISCHGNPMIAEQLCEDLINRGCRLAEPGEFTKLAFLNGKIDLSQAESVAEIISAKNNKHLAAALRNLKGDLSSRLTEIQDKILTLQASIEAYIDFPEDELGAEDLISINKLTKSIISSVKNILYQASQTDFLKKNIRIALVGLPNAGKSSLFNELLGRKRVLVHEKAGTTRDYIEHDIRIKSNWVTIVDTAGIHESINSVEMAGVELSREQIVDSDIILWVIDNSVPYPADQFDEILEMIKNNPKLLILNKIDLPSHLKIKTNLNVKVKRISCSTQEGISDLVNEIGEIISEINGEDNETLLIGKRHETLFSSCLDDVLQFEKLIYTSAGYELASIHLSSARAAVDEIIGIKTTENMLDKLFEQFCIGK